MKLQDIIPQEDDPKATRIRKAIKMQKRVRNKGITSEPGIKGVGANQPTLGHSVLDGPYK